MRRARIAIAYDCFFPLTTGGGERLYRSYAEHAHRRGLEVDYLTAQQWPQGAAPTPPDFRVVPITGPLRLYDAEGVRSSVAALRFAIALFAHLLRRRRTYDALIVSGLPVLNVFAARAALLGTGTRIVVDYLEVWGRAQWVEYAGRLTGNAAWMLQRLAIMITPTAACHSQLTARQLRRERLRGRILVSPGLIDGESPHALSPEAADPPYVLYAGRHIPDKRVHTIPAALAEARRELPHLRLVVLGSGPDTPAIDAAIDAAGVGALTDRPGFVSEERLNELMAGAAVLVNPSRREGYGLVVVEAAAHGTPVVLVDDPGNAATELIDPGVNGFVARSADPSDLGHAIVQAVRGGAQLRKSARSWYESALTSRSVSRTVDGILAALDVAPAHTDTPGARDAGTREGTQ